MTFATDYSRARRLNTVRQLNTAAQVLVAALTLWARGVSGAEVEASPTNSPAARAKTDFLAWQLAYQTNTTNFATAWQFARAAFDWAEFATNDVQRADLAESGIKASRVAIEREPKSVQGHYYLGMNLGQLARTRSLGALRLVDQMEAEFKTARKLDEKFDFAGPDRNLGRLYFEAPSTISVGSRNKARTHMQRAVELVPDFPENRLNLAEARLQWRDAAGARTELDALEAGWEKARLQFTGGPWTVAWEDWERRLQKVRSQLQHTAKPATSPKGKP